MKTNLYIIGNGFDCAHNLPVRFDPDFKKIAKNFEPNHFWDIYQTKEDDIWSSFENLLANPDFNSLEEIFDGYYPDYSSDRESDRDSIILQAMVSGNLKDALYSFTKQAELELATKSAKTYFSDLFTNDDYFITFNYTHTLEKLYCINPNKIVHIHGEFGVDDLLLGYPEGNFSPEEYVVDIHMKGRGPYIKTNILQYINRIEDYYIRSAYSNLYEKCKSFTKQTQINKLENFFKTIHHHITQIIVYGHSCAIDYKYFEYLNSNYPKAKWIFYIYDIEQKYNIINLIEKYNIKNYEFKKI